MIKRERGNVEWILATACLLRGDISTPPTDPRQFRRAKLIARSHPSTLVRLHVTIGTPVAALQEERMSRRRATAAVPAAVRWFHQFRINGPSGLSPDESADWVRWSADDAHLDEFCRTEGLWQKLDVLSAIARPLQEELAADEYDPSLSVRDWLARGSAKRVPR